MKQFHQTPPGFEHKKLGKRFIFVPSQEVRTSHAMFMEKVSDKPLVFSHPGHDVRRHIKRGHRFYLKTDLSSAFDQVTYERITTALEWREIQPEWIDPRKFFFHEDGTGGLIQGAPSSPYLFETYCRFGGLDRLLSEYCDKLGFHYTRYVDDILISAVRPLGGRIGPSIRKIVGQFGFVLSDKKTCRYDSHLQEVSVLGYVIRGTKLFPSNEIAQKLHNSTSDRQTKGLSQWRKSVRNLNNH